ncbi:BlaI/MecI/CopY family transcriptional regulator [Domibacillus sp. PGB-M46]|uniref:BlaI/MecI/CopY family transcriptional regulator n=1 Tax=Domibacillus sp. PGB-M46 TaxID=2910255 RepID=UPI001F59250D|nr:BlaI/MecI/CopY family transcriptional regulator [Domibacillus sp. PGB-M46]MCI2256297.1 BlaI/MecI/CopY family transcriptional regulator [Domibacillus sp. PGB-M46]
MSRSSNWENKQLYESSCRVQSSRKLKEAIWQLLWEAERPYTTKEISSLLYTGEATANSLLHSLMQEKKIKREKITSKINGRTISRYVYYGVEPYAESQQEELSPLMAQVYQLFQSTGQKLSAERVSSLLNLAPTSTATVLYRLYKKGYLSRSKEYSGKRKRYLYVIEEDSERDSSYIIEMMDKLPTKGGTLKDISAVTGISIRTLKEVMLELFKKGQVCRRRHSEYAENESLIYFLRDEKTWEYHISRLLEFEIVQELNKHSCPLSLIDLENQLNVNVSKIRKAVQSMYEASIVERIHLAKESVHRRGYGYRLTKTGKRRTATMWDYFEEIVCTEKQPVSGK